MGSKPSFVAASSSALSRRGDTAVRPAGPWEGEERDSHSVGKGAGAALALGLPQGPGPSVPGAGKGVGA